MFVAFNTIIFFFATKVKKNKIMAIYTILVYTAVQKTGCGSAMMKCSGTQHSYGHVVIRKYVSRLLMGLPGIKVSILA